jgi:YesN/AraC family two-component response regulator
MGGLEVLEQLRQKGITIPTIVMTFHGTEETAVRALRLGACDYLIKPFTIDEMQAALQRAARAGSPSAPTLKRLTTGLLTMPENAPTDNRTAQLERDLAQMRIALVSREKQIHQLQRLLANRGRPDEAATVGPPLPNSPPEIRVTQLEQELIQMRGVLATREKQLLQLQQQLTNSVKKLDMAEVGIRAATWEEDNARLNQVLAQTKQAFSEAEKRVHTLEEVVMAQKAQMGKYQEEAKRLADQLRNVSEAVRLLSQDLGQQVERIGLVAQREKKN